MKIVASKNVCGVHSLTGKCLKYTVVAVVDEEKTDPSGKWTVLVNGKPIRWYAMESPAIGCVRLAKVGAYGITFGEAF